MVSSLELRSNYWGKQIIIEIRDSESYGWKHRLCCWVSWLTRCCGSLSSFDTCGQTILNFTGHTAWYVESYLKWNLGWMSMHSHHSPSVKKIQSCFLNQKYLLRLHEYFQKKNVQQKLCTYNSTYQYSILIVDELFLPYWSEICTALTDL